MSNISAIFSADHGSSEQVNEDPAHLLSDLYVNEEQGRLSSKTSPLDSDELFFSACEKLKTLMKLDEPNDGPSLDELVYVPNLINHIENAISQVLKMGGNIPKSKTNNDVPMADETTSSNHNDRNWNRQRSKVNRRFQNDSQDNPRYTPSNSMEITFNSFLLIHPIVTQMIEHPHKDDFSLNMKHGPRIKKKGQRQDESCENNAPKVEKKTQCYLFGKHVYSITSVSALQTVRRQRNDLERAIEPLILRATGELDYSRHLDILLSICSEPPTREHIIQQTIYSYTDKDIETFGHEFDRIIIHPLAHDRDDLQNSFENSVKRLNDALANILPKGSNGFKGFLDVYGSCLSGLSLGRSSDVDISLHDHAFARTKKDHERGKITLDKFTQKKKRFVYNLHRQIESYGQNMFSNMEAIAFARVPVVKGRYLAAENPFSLDGSLEFDICFLNDIAVVNSSLLREYSKIDPRVRSLMLSVKSWAKAKNLGNAADKTLSSYTWMIMVIFYLQIIGFVPNLQCNLLMDKCGVKFDPRNRFHSVDGLRTVFVTCDELFDANVWTMPEIFKTTPTSCLLAGFFTFYSKIFPWETTAISIRLANLSLQKTVFRSSRFWRMVIEDPFEIHNSHIPHDLGIPMNEGGQNKIYAELRNAANEMQAIFMKREHIVDCIGSIHHVHDPSDELKRAASTTTNTSTIAHEQPSRLQRRRRGRRKKASDTVQNSSDANQSSNSVPNSSSATTVVTPNPTTNPILNSTNNGSTIMKAKKYRKKKKKPEQHQSISRATV